MSRFRALEAVNTGVFLQGGYKTPEAPGQSCFPVAGDPEAPMQKHGE